MGQCPVAYGCYQPDQRGLTCGSGARDQSSFLVPHRHDLPMRCMLDPSRVYEVILLQADVLTRRAELMYREELELDADNNSSSGDNVSEGDCTMSTFAPSTFTEGGRTEVTTYSVATRVAGNCDKYSRPKCKYNGHRPPKRDLPPRRTPTPDRVMEAINENANAAARAKGACQQEQLEGSAFGGAVKNNLALGLVAPCVGLQPAVAPTKFARDEFYNVLQLKMKLHLADYYQNTYLSMFPQSHPPFGLIRDTSNKKEKSPPDLSPSSSDSSSRESATREVAFGSGIPSSSVRLLVDDSSFLDLAMTGSLGLIDRADGSSLTRPPSQQKSPAHYLVLINRRSGVPLAVCALKSHRGPPVVRIYATKSRVIGQQPAASTADLGLNWTDSLPLFAWAEFTTEGEFPMPARYSLYMASGSDGHFEKEPSYRASHHRTGSPDIFVVGRTQMEAEYQGCAFLSMESSSDGDSYLSLSVSRGIDPALMICFAAIVDETVEKTMRLHCELKANKNTWLPSSLS